MERPSEKSCDQAGCGPRKFHCDCKKKFGVNMQGAVDHHGWLLGMSTSLPASTSDCLSFSAGAGSRKGCWIKAFCLFGDDACAHQHSVHGDTFQRMLVEAAMMIATSVIPRGHIQAECAFSVCVQQWGRTLSTKITLKKVNCLCVHLLCRLHSFCSDTRIEREGADATPVCMEGPDTLTRKV